MYSLGPAKLTVLGQSRSPAQCHDERITAETACRMTWQHGCRRVPGRLQMRRYDPGQQLVNPVARVLSDAVQDVGS